MLGLLAPEILIRAYSEGYFPMASSKQGDVYWHCPDYRAVFPIHKIKPNRSLRKSIEKSEFSYSINDNFEYVIEKCSNRDDTWISEEIIEAYCDLHYLGFAHSIEVWQKDVIVGGLYGVAIGAAFFGESMFNDVSNASKAAFYYLVEHLKKQGYVLLDSQYLNHFTEQLGAVEISRKEYEKLLKYAIQKECKFSDYLIIS